MINAVLSEKVVHTGKVVRKIKTQKFIISLEPKQYSILKGLAYYGKDLDEVASELIREGIEFSHMEDIPIYDYQAYKHFVEIELSYFEQQLLNNLALRHGCSTRKMAYTILNFMLKTPYIKI
ncbi:hypothetical protein P5775_29570 [Bacillus cereus]|uniref:hypothetical protein n=1 Tax=Bacillus cereus group TaxID=86661 RepID=UPI0011A36C1B|nr:MULTISPECIES: hypothetical protein [Bacillus cereus group]MDF9626834.1 hypothetical protein [Bacillus cereus]